DLVLARLYEAQAHVARRKLDAVEILGNSAVRGQYHDRADVRPLLGVLVPFISVADSIGEMADRIRRTRQEMPTGRCAGPAVIAHINALLRSRQLRLLMRVEADRENFEFL